MAYIKTNFTAGHTLVPNSGVAAFGGKADEAKESLAKYPQQEIPTSFGTYMEIQFPA